MAFQFHLLYLMFTYLKIDCKISIRNVLNTTQWLVFTKLPAYFLQSLFRQLCFVAKLIMACQFDLLCLMFTYLKIVSQINERNVLNTTQWLVFTNLVMIIFRWGCLITKGILACQFNLLYFRISGCIFTKHLKKITFL